MKKLQIEQMEVVSGGWGVNPQTMNALACNVAFYLIAFGADVATLQTGASMAYANKCF
jgi:hypothetical protein